MAVNSRRFDVRHEPFEAVRTWLEAYCSESGASEHHVWQLQLVIEEFFVNSRTHGYPGTPDAPEQWPIWITLAVDDAGLHITYEDAAVEYNPFLKIKRPDYSGPVESWQIGGLGLPMIQDMCRDLNYARVAGHNRLTLRLPINDN